MDVLLIDASGHVDNVIEMFSVALAQAAYGDHLCIERTGDVGPGFTTTDGGATFTPSAPVPASSRVSKIAFIHRFTDGEFVGVLTAAQQSMALASWVKKLDMVTPEADGTSLDLTDPQVIGGVKLLEQSGLIAVGRAAQILKV